MYSSIYTEMHILKLLCTLSATNCTLCPSAGWALVVGDLSSPQFEDLPSKGSSSGKFGPVKSHKTTDPWTLFLESVRVPAHVHRDALTSKCM